MQTKEYKRFEDIRRINANNNEYWLARELAPVLGYENWQNFSKVVMGAMVACINGGRDADLDFAKVFKNVNAVSKSTQDYELSRYACYLIAQNGDPRKEVTALG